MKSYVFPYSSGARDRRSSVSLDNTTRTIHNCFVLSSKTLDLLSLPEVPKKKSEEPKSLKSNPQSARNMTVNGNGFNFFNSSNFFKFLENPDL